jgi:hypothetical protein
VVVTSCVCRRLAIACVAVLGAIGLLAPPAWAGSGTTLGGYGTPNIDFQVSPGEYGSSCVGPTAQTSGGRTYHFTICEENDADNIYFAIQIDHGFSPGFDVPAFWFDSPDDGKVAVDPPGGCAAFPAPVEDGFNWDMDQGATYTDLYYCFSDSLTIGFDGLTNVHGACTPNNTNTSQSCEFSKPLSSGDPDDFNLAPGGTVGWCFTFDDRSNTANAIGNIAGDVQYPQHCWLDTTSNQGAVEGSAAKYANAKIIGALGALVAEANAKLGKYLAICKFCPPDPSKKLQGELRVVRNALTAGKRLSAVRALKSFIESTQQFVKARRFPKASGAVLVARARRLLERVQHAPSSVRKPFLPGLAKRTNMTSVLPNGNRG